MEPSGIVHPTHIPKPPALTGEAREVIVDFINSQAWELLQKVWEYQYQCTMVHLMNATQNHEHYQGQIKGMAGLMDGITNIAQWAMESKQRRRKDKIPLNENKFFENWAKQNASTKNKITNY